VRGKKERIHTQKNQLLHEIVKSFRITSGRDERKKMTKRNREEDADEIWSCDGGRSVHARSAENDGSVPSELLMGGGGPYFGRISSDVTTDILAGASSDVDTFMAIAQTCTLFRKLISSSKTYGPIVHAAVLFGTIGNNIRMTKLMHALMCISPNASVTRILRTL